MDDAERSRDKRVSNIGAEVNNSTDAGYKCPTCDRPTLGATTGEIATFECEVCGQRVREEAAV